MSSLSERAANVALYAFEPARLPADTFQVVEFEGTEGLSQPFAFELRLMSPDPDVDFGEVINHPATFTMRRGTTDRPVHGIVTNLAQRGRSADYVSYRATLRPRLHRLSLTHQSRVFQEMSVRSILEAVLADAGLSSGDVRFDLQASYAPREFCVQYRESDLAFLHRLMEFEGIYYFFDHTDGQDTIVVTDHGQVHEPMPAPAALPYDEGGGMVGRRVETVDRFVAREQMVAGAVQLQTYDYRTPETRTARADGPEQMPGAQREYGTHARSSDHADRLATVRSEALEARRRTMAGQSDCLGLRSGFTFTLEEHFRTSLNADYLVTHVEHRGSQREGLDLDARTASEDDPSTPDDTTTSSYRNEFRCLPATRPYRPPRTTPKPEVPGVVTATVESAGGEYAYVDDQGRYRARLPFDEREDRSEGTRTLPIRMAQPYTGADYGLHFPNHAGTELLLAFENGDVDRPVALGTAPNPSQPPPVTSDNKMENVLRTYGGNQLLMDDTSEETRVQLRSANAHELRLDDKEKATRLVSTENHEVLLDDENEHLRIRSEGGRTLVLDDDEEAIRLTSKTGHALHLSDADDVVTIRDADEEHVLTLDYAGEKMSLKTSGDIGFEADGALEMTAKSLSIETEKGAEMRVGGDLTQSADGNATLEASGDVTAEASGAMKVAGMDVTVDGTKSLTASGQTKAELSAAQLTVEGSGMAELKGGVVKING